MEVPDGGLEDLLGVFEVDGSCGQLGAEVGQAVQVQVVLERLKEKKENRVIKRHAKREKKSMQHETE